MFSKISRRWAFALAVGFGVLSRHKNVFAQEYDWKANLVQFKEDVRKMNADAEQCDKDAKLYKACMSMNIDLETISHLLSIGADPNTDIWYGSDKPLTFALRFKRFDLAELLLQYGADINNEHVVNHISSRLSEEVLKFVLDHGGDIDKTNKFRHSMIRNAAECGNKDLVVFLLTRGAKDLGNALTIAAQEGHREVVDVLLENGADINFVDRYGNSPLNSAIRNGFSTLAVRLINLGADVRLMRPLNAAIIARQTDVVKTLLDFGLTDDYSILFASLHGRQEMVEIFLKNGTNINACNINGDTPIILAAEHGHRELARFLANNGADIRAKNDYGENVFNSVEKYGWI